jgi:hypothetical protein
LAGTPEGGTAGIGGTGGNTDEGDAGIGGSAGESTGDAGVIVGGGGAGFGPADATSNRLDLLLMIDNSVSMADKQQMLQTAVPDVVGRLVNPMCVDTEGNQYPTETAALEPSDDCPTVGGEALSREFQPIADINVAVITSSLGGFGATSGACANSPGSDQKEDMAHLIGSLPRGVLALNGTTAANQDGLGFLEWRGTNRTTFETAFQNLVMASGEFGCGYEASLEAWYRFLIDPAPYAELAAVSCVPGGTDTNCRAGSGVDETILEQRAAFLRPDSLVTVLMMTDENDCSVKASGQAWYMAQVGAMNPMWRSAAICETDPNNACCYSCGQAPPAGCTGDAVCGDPANTRENGDYYLDEMGRKSIEDQDNLRCWHQKQRFGVDFLFPTARYSNALTSAHLCVTRNDLDETQCGAGTLTGNPLYPLHPVSGEGTRHPSMVFLMGLVGVPWQDLVVDANDTEQMRYQTSAERQAQNTWDLILGDGITPDDPLMIESIVPRATLPPPTAGYLANPINGHEWQPNPPSDLQYACIFPLPTPRDCAELEANDDPRHCDCDGAAATMEGQQAKPLCQAPDGSYGMVQRFGKAYPGIRPLQVLKQIDDINGNAIVTSICPRNVSDDTRQDYGYNPAMSALIAVLKNRLTP